MHTFIEKPWHIIFKNAAQTVISGNECYCTWLNHEDILEVSGENAERFLQGQVTCDVNTLKVGDITLGACCNHKGRMIANFRMHRLSDQRFILTLPKKQGEQLIHHLNKYLPFFKKAKVVLINEAYNRFGFVCPKTFDLTQIQLPWYWPDSKNKSTIQQNYLVTHIAESNLESNRFEIWIGENDTNDFIDTLTRNNIKTTSVQFWLQLDIQSGLAWVLPELSETYIPQEINFHCLSAISWKKGCYTGQEVIARIHYRGKLKTEMCYITIKTKEALKIADKLFDEKKSVGEIVSITKVDSKDEWAALAILRKDSTNTLRLKNVSLVSISKNLLPYDPQ